MEMEDIPLPPSLAVKPNIPWEKQSIEQLKLEYEYWQRCIAVAPGFASAQCAWEFKQQCERWIRRRIQEKTNV